MLDCFIEVFFLCFVFMFDSLCVAIGHFLLYSCFKVAAVTRIIVVYLFFRTMPIKFNEKSRPGAQMLCSSFSPGSYAASVRARLCLDICLSLILISLRFSVCLFSHVFSLAIKCACVTLV